MGTYRDIDKRKAYLAAYKERNRERDAAYQQEYYQRNRAAKLQYASDYREANAEQVRETVKRWHADPANADRRNAYMRDVVARSPAFKRAQEAYRKRHARERAAKDAAWRKANAGANRAKAAAYRAALLQRTPPWVTPDMKAAIRALYQLAAVYSDFLGTQVHVDHIVPLQGEAVSGLHVISNLQVISATDNLRKSNSFA